MIRRLVSLLPILALLAMAAMAQLPAPVALSVTVNTNGVVIAPAAFWAANSNLMSAASPPARGAVTNIAWNAGHFAVSGTNVSLASTVVITNDLIIDADLTRDVEFRDIARLTLDATDSSLGGVASTYVDGGITTLRGITNLNLITPAVHAGTATANQILRLTDANEGTVEFADLVAATPTQATNIALAVGLSGQSGIYTPPLALGWPAEYQFVAAELANGRFAALINPRALVNSNIWTGPAYHVSTNGNDTTGTGLSGAPVRSIWKAIQLGNSNGQPYQVLVGPGMYRMTNSINGYPAGWPTPPSVPLIEPTQPCAIIANGGRVIHSAQVDVASFPTVKDLTHTNTYLVANSQSTRRVFNRLVRDQFGQFVELTTAASAADCNTTPNSFFQSGSSLYLHRSDGVAPTYANTAILANVYTAAFLAATQDLYIEGFDFEGGSTGAIHVDALGSRNVVVVGCSANYAGSVATPIDGVRIRRVSGLVYLQDVEANASSKDGLNFHGDGATRMCVITSQCRAVDNGKAGSSNNGWTTHDDVLATDIGGEYGPCNDGASVHAIETTKSWCLGTVARRRLANGNNGNSPFKVSNSGLMILEHCQGYGDASTNYTFYVQGASATGLTLSTRFFDGVVTNESGTTLTQWTSGRERMSPVTVPFATTNPTASDDSTRGFRPGSWWRNIATTNLYQLVLETPTGAVWRALP